MSGQDPKMPAPGTPEHEQLQGIRAAVEMVASIAQGFAPKLPPQQLLQLSAEVMQQQEALGRVIEDAHDEGRRASHPIWGFKLRHQGEHIAGVRVPKDPAGLSPEQAVHHALVIALVTSPAARTVLAAHGYAVEFFQAKSDTQVSLS